MSNVSKSNDWISPAAMASPSEGYFMLEQVRDGPRYPRSPACRGFTIIAKIKPGTEGEIRWVLFNIGQEKYFMYQGIFDTDFDKYTEDAIQLFTATGVDTAFEKLEGFPADWKTNAPAFIKFAREHQCPSFLECGEYPYVSAAEIKKATGTETGVFVMLDHMQ